MDADDGLRVEAIAGYDKDGVWGLGCGAGWDGELDLSADVPGILFVFDVGKTGSGGGIWCWSKL